MREPWRRSENQLEMALTPGRLTMAKLRGSVQPDESGVIRGRTRRDSLKLTGHQASILLVFFSAPPALMTTFTASSIGSLKGTSTRSRPFV